MQREEAIAKALREYREKLVAELDTTKKKQKELIEKLAESQLAINTLSTLVKVKVKSPAQNQELKIIEPRPTPAKPIPEPKLSPETIETVQISADRKGHSREKLKSLAFPIIQSRFSDSPFEVSKVRDMLDEIEPEVPHSYEVAWNLCNDLLREGKLKQAGLRRLPKGVVRLFKLRGIADKNHNDSQTHSVVAGGSGR